MQTVSPLPARPRTTLFGSRLPEPTAAARADLEACRVSMCHGSKTFRAASLLLPRSVREPASALYAFCRLADDAVDGPDGRRGSVERLRQRLVLAYAGTPQAEAADRALATVVARRQIPFALFEALLEGFEWDLDGRRYETLEDLQDYAARVAGTVGAMMALLMGARSAEALARACDLGVAMQLSNIARDVGEDARLGRLYLPRRWLAEAGIDAEAWLAAPTFSPALASVVQRLLDAAEDLYGRVGDGVARLPLACRPGINAARLVYREIGREVARQGFDSVHSRAHVAGWRKAVLISGAATLLAPRKAARPLPPLAANRFLVEAALAGAAPFTNVSDAAAARQDPAPPRADALAFTLELFARLEWRERLRASSLGVQGGRGG